MGLFVKELFGLGCLAEMTIHNRIIFIEEKSRFASMFIDAY